MTGKHTSLIDNITHVENVMQKARESMVIQTDITEIARFYSKTMPELELPKDSWTDRAYPNLKTGELIDICRRMNGTKNAYKVKGLEKDLQINQYSLLNVLLHLHAFLYNAYTTTKDQKILYEKSSLELFIIDFNRVLPIVDDIHTSLMNLDGVYISLCDKIFEVVVPHIKEINEHNETGESELNSPSKIFSLKSEDKNTVYSKVFVIHIPQSTERLVKDSITGFFASVKSEMATIIQDSYVIISQIEEMEEQTEKPNDTLLNEIQTGMQKILQKQNIRMLREPKLFLNIESLIGTYRIKSVPYKVIDRQFIPAGSRMMQRIKSTVRDSRQMKESSNITESTDTKNLIDIEKMIENELKNASKNSAQNDAYIDHQKDESFSVNTDSDLSAAHSTGVGNQAVGGTKTDINVNTSLGVGYDRNNSTQTGANASVLQVLESTSNLLDKAINHSVNETNSKRQSYITTSSDISTETAKEESSEREISNDTSAGVNYIFYELREKNVQIRFITNISVRFSNVIEYETYEISNLDGLKPFLTETAFEYVKQQLRSACVLPDIMGKFYDMYTEDPIPHFIRKPYGEFGKDSFDDESPYIELLEAIGEIQGIPVRMITQLHNSPGSFGVPYLTQDVIDTRQFIENLAATTHLKLKVLTQEKLLEYVNDADSAFKLLVDAQDLINKNILLNTMHMNGINPSGLSAEVFNALEQGKRKKKE